MITELNKVRVMYAGDKAKEKGVFISSEELERMVNDLIAKANLLMAKDLLSHARDTLAVAEFLVDLEKKAEGML